MAVVGLVLFSNATGPPTTTFDLDGAGTPFPFTPTDSANNTYPVFYTSPVLSSDEHTLTIKITSNNGANFYLDGIVNTLEPGTTASSGAMPEQTYSFPSTTPSSQPSSVKSTPVGAIVGGVVGGLALLLGAAFAFYFLFWRYRNAKPYVRRSAILGDPSKFKLSLTRISNCSPCFPVVEKITPFSPDAVVPLVSQLVYPQPPPSSVSDSSAPSAVTGVSGTTTGTLRVANAAEAGHALTPAQRKAAEAGLRTTPEQVQQYEDSGYRFDATGAPSGSALAAVPVPPDVPPVYSES